MEQLTWPRGSGGHIFSTISTSDYGEYDWRQRKKDCSHVRPCQNEACGAGRQSKGQLFHNSDHHHHLQIEQSSGYDIDQFAFVPPRHLIKRQDDGGKQYYSHEVVEVPGKTHNVSSVCEGENRKQEVCWSHAVINADVKKSKDSMVSAPHTPARHESNVSVSSRLSGNYCPRTMKHTHGIQNFAMLPDDILLRIMGSFSWKDLWSASRVCRSWCQALAPLREAMHFVHWGKRFKHGQGGVLRNLDKALHSFLNGAQRGCTAAMVDAGLLLWQMGQKQEGLYWYTRAAELGDPAGQCNLGLAFLQDPRKLKEAVQWFRRAALSGHPRAQYSLGLCLQQGRGVDCSIVKAARWYQQAAVGGNAKAMYNLALCYRRGEGLNGDSQNARRWMKRAALAGHPKAQFEHGLTLFAENEGGLALVFLELATRAGETAATHVRDILIQQLSPRARTHAISCADKWQAKLSARS